MSSAPGASRLTPSLRPRSIPPPRRLLIGAIAAVGRFGSEWWSVPSAVGTGPTVDVLTWNLEVGSRPPADTVSFLRQHPAQVVALEELTTDVAAAIAADPDLSARFPSQALFGTDDVFGLGVLSAYPLSDVVFEPRVTDRARSRELAKSDVVACEPMAVPGRTPEAEPTTSDIAHSCRAGRCVPPVRMFGQGGDVSQQHVRVPDLARLNERHYGLSASVCGSHAEAASVCLDRWFQPPQTLTVTTARNVVYELDWRRSDARAKAAWANTTDTTEAGAYGVALAVAEIHLQLVALARVGVGGGADYWVGTPGSDVNPIDGLVDLERTLRLEVSGIVRCGSDAALNGRLAEKVRQLRRGGQDHGVAAVVGFSLPAVAFEVS